MKMTFPASMNHLHQMLQFIRVEVRAAGFEGTHEIQVELALEEAIVNIIRHGYEKSSGSIEIHCTRIPFIGIKVVLIDSGIPYNPLLNKRKVDPTAPGEIRTIGGYGVYLILTIMNVVEYEYKEGHNILTLIKFLDLQKKLS